MGTKGLVWSASAMGVLLNEGIGDTIRVSLTPRPGGDRREEVYAACELLQALGLRSFSPSVTACPGCGRTTSTTFQELAERTQDYIREMMPEWKTTLRRRRSDDARRHGLRRQRPRRIEGGEHRHQPARHRRSAELPGLTSTAAITPRCAARTTSSRRRSASSSTTTSPRDTRDRQQGAETQSIRLTKSAPSSYSFRRSLPVCIIKCRNTVRVRSTPVDAIRVVEPIAAGVSRLRPGRHRCRAARDCLRRFLPSASFKGSPCGCGRSLCSAMSASYDQCGASGYRQVLGDGRGLSRGATRRVSRAMPQMIRPVDRPHQSPMTPEPRHEAQAYNRAANR